MTRLRLKGGAGLEMEVGENSVTLRTMPIVLPRRRASAGEMEQGPVVPDAIFRVAAAAREDLETYLVAIELEQRQIALGEAVRAIPRGILEVILRLLWNDDAGSWGYFRQKVIVPLQFKLLACVEALLKRDKLALERLQLLLCLKQLLVDFQRRLCHCLVFPEMERVLGCFQQHEGVAEELQRVLRRYHDGVSPLLLRAARMMRRLRAGVKGGGDA